MGKYNKIVLASKMFIEAHNKFDSAKSEMDYVSSMLLSGAVVGIVAPLLKEQGGHPMHEILARISNDVMVHFMVSEGNGKAHQGIFRKTYNAFRHTGNKRNKIKPTEDLEIEADIKLDAGRMLDVAKSDFNQIEMSHNIRSQISNEFIQLLESAREYA